MKKSLLLAIFFFVAKIGASQGLVNWEWEVDSNIVYQDLKFQHGFIYGVGQSGTDGILAQKDTNGGTNWMVNIPGINLNQLTLSEQDDILGIGTFSGTITINGNSYSSNGLKDVIVIRCNSTGTVTLVKQFGSTGDDEAIDICVDHHGAFYIATKFAQPVTQSGNTFSGNLIAKFDSLGVAGFLHSLNTESGPTNCNLIAIKYSRLDSSIVVGANYDIYSGSGPVAGSIKYNNGITSTVISNFCNFLCGNVVLVQIPISGYSFSIWDDTYSDTRTYYMTDAVIKDNAKIYYAQRYQFSLFGSAHNTWTKSPSGSSGYEIPSSDGNWGPVNACGSTYKWGRPIKLDYDSNYFYGTLYQPELNCYTFNCSNWFAVKVQESPYVQSYVALNIFPVGVTGHNGNYYISSSNGGLYKSCNNNCPSIFPLTILPAPNITMCPDQSAIIQQPPCFNIYGGIAPYTYSWQPSTGLSNSSISNPTVSGLAPGTYNYTLTVTDQNMNVVMDTVTVTVITPANITATLTPAIPVCGDSLLLVASGTSGYFMSWYDIQNNYHYLYNDSLSLVPTYNSNIRIIGTDQYGCKDTLVQPLNLISQIDTSYAYICSSQLPYVWNGLSFNSNGYHTASFTNINGCDSIKKLYLLAYTPDIIYDSITICANQLPYNWNGNLLLAAGTYTDTLTGLWPPLGCDSIVIFKLKVEPNISGLTATPSVICIQDSSKLKLKLNTDYCIPIVQYSPECISNFQFHTINNSTGSSGCSAYTYYQLNANVVAGMSYPFSITSFNQGKNIWIDYNRDGDFDDVGEMVFYSNGAGNTVNGIISIPSSAFNGKTRLRVACRWNTSYVNTPCYNFSYGEYEDYNITISGGTDNIYWSPSGSLNATVGDSVVASPIATTTYTVSVYSSSGCVLDSIITVNVIPNDTTILNHSICNNQIPYSWYGNNLISTGTYYHVLNNSNGCDSVLKLQFTVNQTQLNNSNLLICESSLPYLWNGQTIHSSGYYSYLFSNQFGCDSIVQLAVSVIQNDTTVLNQSVCSNQLPYSWYGTNIISAGNYYHIMSNVNGCDSVLKLQFTVYQTQLNNSSIQICESNLPYTWNGQTINLSGNYSSLFSNQYGCDSIEQLAVSVIQNDTTALNQSICSNQLPYLWYGNNLISPGTYTHVLNNSYGCDSVLNLQFTILPSDSNSTSISICPDQLPFVWNGINLTTAGNVYISSTNSVGCDSISGLSLFVYPQPVAVIGWNGTLLSTTSLFTNYQWNLNGNVIAGATDSTYTPSQDGNYTVMVTDNNGCIALSNEYHFTSDAVGSIFTNHFSIFPNPANDQTMISFTQPFSGSIELINSLGQIGFQQNCQGAEKEVLHLANFASGSYLIRLSTNEWSASVKLMLAR